MLGAASTLACLTVVQLLTTRPASAEGAPFPGKQWDAAPPADVGLDEARLAQARDYALTGGGSGVVVRRGKLVMSWGDVRRRYDPRSNWAFAAASADCSRIAATGNGYVWVADRRDGGGLLLSAAMPKAWRTALSADGRWLAAATHQSDRHDRAPRAVIVDVDRASAAWSAARTGAAGAGAGAAPGPSAATPPSSARPAPEGVSTFECPDDSGVAFSPAATSPSSPARPRSSSCASKAGRGGPSGR